ncbi:hypothetical protein Q4504_03595 [Mesomycoplasma ovipneumoniae]|uniref:DUF1934 domain-containing protein n=1 Tax=Mesomycoplasma ovipneumoniae TaxID=29562 RepID=A0AAW6Q775_9BACT|nr:hypothetical protein [Mesomycoplasma ovipneumoniae]MCN0158233.1 hypothetical protein [Mesomycoplasma ovipneumoniae]MDF9627480.1 hypothetical protein [Mesomycoplasma ovipneumoniae]MDO4157410.1 hypothetical protein [Mesomycoplasma ovipneumoniae]MDO4158496.1 hypothetical protein [Mesomycoplasma ovipneumoniae]MDO6821417.1 hypothetical protein [Mesomycoplasma ovipneumoniae]
MKVRFSLRTIIDDQDKKMVEFINTIYISKQIINNTETDVYETQNPENNMMIRFEIFDKNLTVFSGENTLFFELNNYVENMFITNGMELIVNTLLTKLEINSEFIKIEYDLFLKNNGSEDSKISTYLTTLEFIND